MSPKSPELTVQPKVLAWARKSAGKSVEDVAKRLKVPEDIIGQWESGTRKPRLVEAERLADFYQRPLAVFFLREPPPEPPLPKDFRTLPAEKRLPLSSATRLAIRRARRLQYLYGQLATGLGRRLTSQIGEAGLFNDPEAVATEIRKRLGVTIKTQLLEWKNEYSALNGWKKATENRGLLVLEMTLPLKETRGFSLAEDGGPVIVLNIRDSVRARIFSLFHEYAHLLLHASGICDMEDQHYASEEVKSTEKFCNHFAGAVLVPQNSLLRHSLVRPHTHSSEWSNYELIRLVRDLKVSQEVILRRLLICGLTTRDFYLRKREESRAREELIRREEKERRRKRREYIPIPQPMRCIKENGIPFVSLVLDAHGQERITFSDVADYLGVHLKYLPKIEKLAESRV